ncbi:site-specific DNA recombinase [Succiniclasticum ruminis]|uniref:Site-specific DNA recombinase n=1 Tax=Succiniclasticum ruminis TaxID=40841 RepID=A0A1G6KRC4_9FIRM|nr:recombinase family protein [Succiniclasticum ruminis]SDC33600.1 site-specific DNA recombinase [Succiniclasticum ruminis]
METTTIVKVAVYCRVSSDDQAERGTIDVQRDFAKNYIELYHLSLYDYYCDDGVSGTIPMKDRPEGARLLQDAAGKQFDSVLFYKLDRIGRKTTVILDAIQAFTAYGIAVRSMTEPLDTNTPTGKFLITTLSGIAELDRDSTLMRMHSGALVAAKKGKWLGGIVPFGYLTDKDGFLVINREKIPGLDYTEEDIVKIVFSLCANENKSSIEIADYVNALGVPTRYIPNRNHLLRKRPGKRLRNNAPLWGPSRVLRMLRNSLYKGYRIYGLRATLKDYEPIEQRVPAIVDEDTWNRANRVISSKYFLTPRRRQGRHLLQGYLYCGHCGHTYCGYADRLKKDRQTYYYRCNGRDAYNPAWRCDSSAGINADWIEQLVLDYCASVLREHSFLDPAPATDKKEDCTALELHTLDSAIKRLATEKDSILSLYRKNLITMDDLTRQLELIRQERKALQKRVEELNQPTTEEIIAQNRQTSAEFFRRFQDIFPRDYDLRNLSFQTCRDILELFIDRVTIYTVKNNDKSFYASFRVELQDKLGNTRTYSIAATDRLKTQQNKIGKKLSSLGEKLRSLRLERGYTQKTVAEHIGLSVNAVNAFENQRRSQTNPAFQHHTIRKLADFYGVPYEALAIWNYSSVETGGHKLFAQIRDVKGITNDELLADIGVSKPTFRKYLKGIATEQTRQKIESYFATARKWLKKIMQSR